MARFLERLMPFYSLSLAPLASSSLPFSDKNRAFHSKKKTRTSSSRKSSLMWECDCQSSSKKAKLAELQSTQGIFPFFVFTFVISPLMVLYACSVFFYLGEFCLKVILLVLVIMILYFVCVILLLWVIIKIELCYCWVEFFENYF